MFLALDSCIVREFRDSDVPSLARHANDREVWINLRDRFPHPYTEAHAQAFLAYLRGQGTPTVWALEVEGEAAGAIGVILLSDVERVSAEIGYWLGRAYWGRGVTTAALRAVTTEVFKGFDLTRLFALPFAHNAASIRVLEKAGYSLEGRLPQSAIKDGVIRDQLLFGAYRQNWRG